MPASYSLKTLLTPSAIGIIGASLKEGSLGKLAWQAATSMDSTRPCFAINPKYDKLGNKPCTKDPKLIKTPLEAVVITPSAQRLPDIFKQLGHHTPLLNVLLANNSEAWRQPEVMAALEARRTQTGARFLGPSSYGLMIPGQRLNLSLFAQLPKPGSIALLTQSGPIASVIMEDIRDTELGFSAVVSTGAEMDLSLADWIEHFAHDKNTRVIAIEFQHVKNPRAFFSALKTATRHKAVVVLASRLPKGSEAIIHSVVKRTGVWLTESIEQFLASITALASNRLPRANRLAILCTSGGMAQLSSQNALHCGAELSRLSPQTMNALKEAQFTHSFNNPISLSRAVDPSKAVSLVLQDPNIDGVLLVSTPSVQGDMPLSISNLVKNVTGSQKPLLTVITSDRLARIARSELQSTLNAPISIFPTLERACHAFECLVDRSKTRLTRQEAPADRPSIFNPAHILLLRDIITKALESRRFSLEMTETTSLAQLLGFEVSSTHSAATIEEGLQKATLLGWPLWAKVSARGLEGLLPPSIVYVEEDLKLLWSHSREALINAQALPETIQLVLQAHQPSVDAIGIHLELDRDPLVGPFIRLTRNGTQTLLPLPLNYDEANQRLTGLFSGIALNPTAKDVLTEALCRLSDAVASIPALYQIDLSLRLTEASWLARECTVRLAERPVSPDLTYSHLLLPSAPLEKWRTVVCAKGELTLRPLLDGDFHAVERFVGRLSEKTLYLRFHTRAPMTLERVVSFYEHDPIYESVWVLADKTDIHGIARWHRSSDSSEAEFGIVVEDAWHRNGLAKVLLNQLILSAKKHGITALIGHVLKGNDAMQHTMHHLGFVKRPSSHGDTEPWVYEIAYNAEHS